MAGVSTTTTTMTKTISARVTFSQIHLRVATRVIPFKRRNSPGFAAERIYGTVRVRVCMTLQPRSSHSRYRYQTPKRDTFSDVIHHERYMCRIMLLDGQVYFTQQNKYTYLYDGNFSKENNILNIS